MLSALERDFSGDPIPSGVPEYLLYDYIVGSPSLFGEVHHAAQQGTEAYHVLASLASGLRMLTSDAALNRSIDTGSGPG